MKIKWIAEEREVPYCGVFQDGDIRDISDEVAKGLIRQGLAVPFVEEKPKKSNVKEEKEG